LTEAADRLQDIPTFSECVIGYLAWDADSDAQLWPLHSRRRPWLPGINTARCNCRTTNSLRFEWYWHEGRRVVEPAPAHPAPEPGCACGLYSWRRPPRAWYQRVTPNSPLRVIGAIASWGHMQVHDGGFRAEHACVVTLAYRGQTPADAMAALERIAARYRVELVPVGELEQAASRHGTPLPATLRPRPAESEPEMKPVMVAAPPRAPDLLADESGASAAKVSRFGERMLDDPLPLRPYRRLGLRGRAGFWVLEWCVAIAFVILAVTTYQSEANTSFVQRHGKRVNGRVQSIEGQQHCGPGYGGACYLSTRLAVRLFPMTDGVRVVDISYAHAVHLRTGQHLQVLLDPTDPSYAELPGQPRTSGGVWIVAALLAAASIAVVAVDGRSVARLRRHLAGSV